MKQKIWCLFSIDNEYYQPGHNLVFWSHSKPSFERLRNILNVKPDKDDDIISVVRILDGKEARINNTDYRLKQIDENTVL